MKPPLTRLRVGLYGLAFVVNVASASAGSWPVFRGPHMNGLADNAKPPVHFGPEQNMLWKADVSPGHSSPVTWEDALFLTGSRDKQLITLCLDRRTGKLRWDRPCSSKKTHKINSRATSTPVTDGKSLFVYFSSFGLLASTSPAGNSGESRCPCRSRFRGHGTGTSPILADGKLIIYLQQEADSHRLALDPADGREICDVHTVSQQRILDADHMDGRGQGVDRSRGRCSVHSLYSRRRQNSLVGYQSRA